MLNKMRSKKIVKTKLARRSLLVIVVLAVFLAVAISKNQSDQCSQDYRSDKVVTIVNELSLNAEVVDTAESRQKGLSVKNCINDSNAMLFVFESSDLHGFWMKDMKFSIDIIWLDSGKRVVDIRRGVSPDSYPEVFYPSGVALYVLETSPGFLESADVSIGSQLSW